MIGQGVFILCGVENCHLPLTKPVAVNTGLALPRSPWCYQRLITSSCVYSGRLHKEVTKILLKYVFVNWFTEETSGSMLCDHMHRNMISWLHSRKRLKRSCKNWNRLHPGFTYFTTKVVIALSCCRLTACITCNISQFSVSCQQRPSLHQCS